MKGYHGDPALVHFSSTVDGVHIQLVYIFVSLWKVLKQNGYDGVGDTSCFFCIYGSVIDISRS